MPFIPSTLKQVREITGCSEEDAAKRVNKDVQTIRRWESDANEELPTLAQAKSLAKYYRYSAGVFLLDELPGFIRVPELRDFRSLTNDDNEGPESWSRNLRFLVRQMEMRQEFAKTVIQRHETGFQPWINSVEQNAVTPDDLASMMRELLRVEDNAPPSTGCVDQALKEWITKFENFAGIFVFQTDNVVMPIEIGEMRGVSMADLHAPVITLNSKDAPAGRIFTLFHEFAHLWLGASGVSASDGLAFSADTSANRATERYCDQTAASALMPVDAYMQLWSDFPNLNVIQKIQKLAGHFRVSAHASTVRALTLSRIDFETYSEIRAIYGGPQTPEVARRTSVGGGNYYATFRRNAGTKYINLVLGEFFSDQITVKEAANLLGARIPSVFRLAEYVGFGT